MRRHGLPIAFVLRDAKPEETLEPKTIEEWIGKEAGLKIVAEAVRTELDSAPREQNVPSLTVAICTRARTEALARCLDSLESLREGHGFEILVVDNAPPDEATAELVARRPGIRYAREPRPGLDFARNLACQEASGAWIAYLDDDVVVDPGWHAGLVDVWTAAPEAAAITGLVLPYELATTAQILFERRGGFRRGFDKRLYRSTLPGNSLHPAGSGMFGTGGNMAFRRDVLEKLGGFDEALDTGRPLPGGGDLDIYFRVIDADHILAYEPRCLVFHEHRKTESGLRHQYYTWGLGLMAYAAKHMRPGQPRKELFQRLTRWWFRDMLRQIKDCLRGRHVLPAEMLVAELAGGVVGLCGEYDRSLRRIEKIKADHR